MLKVILVDDEYLVMESVKKCINWGELGYEIVGQALDGEEALNLVEKTKPHIAIVDINMPFINGLEFSKIIHNKYSYLKIILLTGYSNFEYAREALKWGVTNYVLKPVDKNELSSILLQLKSKIEGEQTYTHYIKEMEYISKENQALMKERFVLTKILHATDEMDDNTIHRFKQFYPNFCSDKVLVLVWGIDNLNKLYKSDENKQLWRFAARNVIEEIMGSVNFISLYDSNDNIIMLLNPCEKTDDFSEPTYIKCCRKAIYSISRYLPFTVTVGIGSEQNNIQGISNSYADATLSYKNKLVLGRNRIIEFEELWRNSSFSINVTKIRKSLFISLRMGNEEAIHQEINAIYDTILNEKISLENIVLLTAELLLIAEEFSNENDLISIPIINDSDINSPDIYSPNINTSSQLNIFDQSEDIEDIKNVIMQKYSYLIKTLNNSKKTSSQIIVEQAKAYIDSHLMDTNINLILLANNIFVNPSYLSSIFKKETGTTITDYIKDSRMMHAKDLMVTGVKNIMSISEMTGFDDVCYFRKCFKKAFGVTPSEYIDMLNK